MATLVDCLRRNAADRPDAEAVVLIERDAERVLTYRDFLARSERYAAALQAVGIRPGDLVVLVLEHGEAVMCAFWGAMLVNAVPSIFPFLSDKLDPERYFSSVRQLIAHAAARAVIATAALRPRLEAALSGLDVALLTLDQVAVAAAPPLLTAPDRRDDVAFLQHSSGSTGLQKGVMLSHRAVLNQIAAYGEAIALTPDDVIVSWLPLYHDMGLIAGFIMPLVRGVKLVLMSPFHWVRAPQILLHAIHRHRGTLCWLPNFAYNLLATRVRDSALEGVDLASWRAAINCSEPVYAESHRLFASRYALYGFREQALASCYAMAENTFAVTQSDPVGPPRVDRVARAELLTAGRAVPAGQGEAALELVSCGRPIPRCEIQIVGADGRPLPERSVGEILVRSDSMLDGYYRRPDLTAEALIDGWYRTGDMGYVAAGELYVTGRKKDLIIVGGKNIYPQDIENLLNDIAGLHPGRAVAFGVYNDSLGTEDIAVVAEVDVTDDEAKAAISREVRARVVQALDVTARYVHLVPRRWLIKTSSGKVARAANRDKFIADVLQAGRS